LSDDKNQTTQPQSSGAGFGQRIWDLFASVKLSFSLLLILAAVSVAGTLIAQNQPPELYLREFGQGWGGLILGLRINDAYHAPWFYLLMGCLAANLIVCSLNRLPVAIRLMKADPQAALAKPRPPQESLTVAGDAAEVESRARAALGKVGQVHQSEAQGPTVMFAQRGAYSRLGVYVVHLSVLIIFVGGMVGNLFGFSGFMTINEGQSQDHVVLERGGERPLGFAVRLDKFTIERYPDGQVSEYRSDVTFLAGGKEIKKASLIVNDPAELEGIDFYQASYGTGIKSLKVRFEPAQGESRVVELLPEVWNELSDGGRVGVAEYRGQVRMGGMYEGPIARLVYQPPGGEAVGVTAFAQGAKFPRRGPVGFVILEAASVPYTGLSVKYDPGVWLIWVGCTLMVLGFLVTFYMSHQKVWVSLKPTKGGVEVMIAGSTNKNRAALGRRLKRLASELGR